MVIDGERNVYVVAESNNCGELVDSYKFVLESLFQMRSHVRGREKVFTIFPDKFLDATNATNLLNGTGIAGTCRLFWDYHHIVVGQGNHDVPESIRDGHSVLCGRTI